MPEAAQLMAVADPVVEVARSLAQEQDCDWYASEDELLAQADVDAVCICAPSGMHADLAEKVLRAGQHVIIEKPIDVSLDAVDRLLDAQRCTNLKVAVVSQHRFDPAAQLVHAAAPRSELGRLTAGSAEVPWWRSQGYYDSATWRGTLRWDGGGALLNQSIHTIDLLDWIMGPAVEVMAWTARLAHERIEVEDTAVAVIRFDSGAVGTVLGTTAAYPGLATRLSIYGDRGSAVVDNDQLTYFHAVGTERQADAAGLLLGAAGSDNQAKGLGAIAPAASADPSNLSMTHQEQLRDFCEAIEQDRPPLIDGHAGRQTAALVLALYESAATGRSVRLA